LNVLGDHLKSVLALAPDLVGKPVSTFPDHARYRADYIARSKRISRRNAPLDGKTRAASATGGSPASSLSSTASAHEHGTFRGDANFQRAVQITMLRCCFRNRAQIGDANELGRDSTESSSDEGMGMTEKEKRLAKEREEIAARVASFRATQEKFEREREEYYAKTLQAARSGKTIRLWT
jgi:hypothetical protein